MASTSGKALRATYAVGNTVLAGITRAEPQDVADELDSTDSNSSPYTDTDIGTIGIRITIDGHFRPGDALYPALKVGTEVSNVKVYPHGTGEDYWLLPLAICLPGTNSVEVKGKVEYTIVIANKGIFYRPGDTYPP